MNELKTTEAVAQQNHVESAVKAEPDKSSRPQALGASGHLQLRRGLLVCIALMVAWLTYSVLGSLNQIDAEMEMIRANLLLAP